MHGIVESVASQGYLHFQDEPLPFGYVEGQQPWMTGTTLDITFHSTSTVDVSAGRVHVNFDAPYIGNIGSSSSSSTSQLEGQEDSEDVSGGEAGVVGGVSMSRHDASSSVVRGHSSTSLREEIEYEDIIHACSSSLLVNRGIDSNWDSEDNSSKVVHLHRDISTSGTSCESVDSAVDNAIRSMGLARVSSQELNRIHLRSVMSSDISNGRDTNGEYRAIEAPEFEGSDGVDSLVEHLASRRNALR